MTQSALNSTNHLLSNIDQLVGLPGSPGHAEELVIVAGRAAALMRSSGLTTEVIPTQGAPLVVGRRSGRSPFTLMLYHHYDVAPSGPWRAWHHEPHQLAERDGMLYGRGVAAGKGPLAAHLNALMALQDADGQLPCEVVVVAEGEGLAGSPHLASALFDYRDLLRADACLATNGDRNDEGRPFCYAGTKGSLQIRLRATGATQALPSGLTASVPNPLWRLLWALTHIKSDQEEILIEGFYDDVDGPDRAEGRALRAAHLNEESRTAAWSLSQFLFGMSGPAVVLAEATLPTCNISSITVEPISEMAVIPTAASARLDFQLVPRQHPHALFDLIREHLNNKGLADIEIERLPGGYPTAQTPLDNAFIAQLSNSGSAVYGAPLTILPRGPFALPLALFGQAYGIPTASIGLARPDSAIFAPNERIPLADLLRHGQLLIELMAACGQQ